MYVSIDCDWTRTLICNYTIEELGSFKKLTSIGEPCSLMLWRKMRMTHMNAFNEDVRDVEVDANAILLSLYVLYDHVVLLFFSRKLSLIN